jgi:hypothetical protein
MSGSEESQSRMTNGIDGKGASAPATGKTPARPSTPNTPSHSATGVFGNPTANASATPSATPSANASGNKSPSASAFGPSPLAAAQSTPGTITLSPGDSASTRQPKARLKPEPPAKPKARTYSADDMADLRRTSQAMDRTTDIGGFEPIMKDMVANDPDGALTETGILRENLQDKSLRDQLDQMFDRQMRAQAKDRHGAAGNPNNSPEGAGSVPETEVLVSGTQQGGEAGSQGLEKLSPDQAENAEPNVGSVTVSKKEPVDPTELEKALDYDPDNGSGDIMNGLKYGFEPNQIVGEAADHAKRKFPNEAGVDDARDAFRHALGAYLLAKRYTVDEAKGITDGHERRPYGSSQYATNDSQKKKDSQTASRLQDLYNNRVGLDAAADPRNSNRRPEDVIWELYQRGLLQTEPFELKNKRKEP